MQARSRFTSCCPRPSPSKLPCALSHQEAPPNYQESVPLLLPSPQPMRSCCARSATADFRAASLPCRLPPTFSCSPCALKDGVLMHTFGGALCSLPEDTPALGGVAAGVPFGGESAKVGLHRGRSATDRRRRRPSESCATDGGPAHVEGLKMSDVRSCCRCLCRFKRIKRNANGCCQQASSHNAMHLKGPQKGSRHVRVASRPSAGFFTRAMHEAV
jgi:hypothetical protein